MDEALSHIIKSSRAKKDEEATNVKNPLVFDTNYEPKKILVRQEIPKISDDIVEYEKFKIPRHVIIYGSKGSGKTLTILSICQALKGDGRSIMDYIYINCREVPTSYKIYAKIGNTTQKGLPVQELREASDKFLTDHTLLILDEVDFLKDFDILYHTTRFTKANLILLTQKVYWYQNMSDESVKSSLQPDHVVFADYNTDQISQILNLRAEAGLNNYSQEAIALLSTLIVKEYRSDARIGIKALAILGKSNKWTDKDVYNAIRQASLEVEGETLKNLNDKDLMVFNALIKYTDTNKAFNAIAKSDSFYTRGISKPTFLQSATHLQNLGLLSLIKKRSGRFYTLEAQMLISDTNIVSNEFERRYQE